MSVPSITREQALAFRQRATHLNKRLPRERLLEAGFAGLQDSSPRSAVLALHARVDGVAPDAWKDTRFVQVWGPRGAVYVVPRKDVAIFTLGFLPRDPTLRSRIEAAARAAKKAYRGHPMQNYFHGLRVASASGALRIEWDGSRTHWWLVDPPKVDPESARLELARRFLHSAGPATPGDYAWWAGIPPPEARDTFRFLEKEIAEVNLGGRQSWILRKDLDALKNAEPIMTVRLLPPGDPYLANPDRKMLVPNPRSRAELWPKSVWPGTLLLNGELVAIWRRQLGRVIVHPWCRLQSDTKASVKEEVESMPIASARKEVRWIN